MGNTGLQLARIRAPRDVWYAARGLLRHRREVLRGVRFGFLNRLPGMTGAQAALAYVLANPDVSCAVFGTTRMGHLTQNLAASGMRLPDETVNRIRAANGAP
jgi:aryl-alcohol dehydrogenase-like predicted oxidoreductase